MTPEEIDELIAHPDRFAEAVRTVPYWHHTLDFGNGVVSPGLKTPEILNRELVALRIPELAGKSVLDIGAWDGFFSFEAERRGAARVVALDHFVWCVDWRGGGQGRRPADNGDSAPYPFLKDAWFPETLIGKFGFDLGHRVYRSRVEAVVEDFMVMDLKTLGTFDVVFFFGVLYHLKNPLGALERLYEVTGEVALIETEAIHLGSHPRASLCEFYESDELNSDPTNWWAPTAQALAKMCRAAGFAHVDILTVPPAVPGLVHYRLSVHAWKDLSARQRSGIKYEDVQAEVIPAPSPPVVQHSAEAVAAPPPPALVAPRSFPVAWNDLKAATEDIAQRSREVKRGYERGGVRGRLARWLTKGFTPPQNGSNRATASLLRKLLKVLSGPIQKRFKHHEDRIRAIEEALRRRP